jgi:hypothetical protein
MKDSIKPVRQRDGDMIRIHRQQRSFCCNRYAVTALLPGHGWNDQHSLSKLVNSNQQSPPLDARVLILWRSTLKTTF